MAIELISEYERNRINLVITGLSATREYFEFDGHRWMIRFQSRIRKPGDGWSLSVQDRLPEDILEDPSPASPLLARVARLLAHQASDQINRGWHLKWKKTEAGKVGVEGWFDLTNLPLDGQKSAYAPFHWSADGEDHRCEIFVELKPYPRDKPVERDWRRGASAGLPTLGKRG